MAQSKDVTASNIWHDAVRDLGTIGDVSRYDRFDLINRAVKTVSGQFYDLMSQSYMTDAVISASTSSVYDTGSTGTYIAATHTLALQTPSANITTADIGKLVVFRIGSTVYTGTVLSIISTSSFTINSDSYPAGNGTLAMVTILGTSNTISLANLRIMRTGANIRLELTTTSTATVRVVSQRDYDTFSTTGGNIKTIVWCFSGDTIKLKKGDGLSSYGTITLHYPRVPDLVTSDASGIDLPDGAAIEIAIIYLRGLIQRRLNFPIENNEATIQQLVANMYQTFGQEVSAEVVKDKVLALK
jgi:hypothetical protein